MTNPIDINAIVDEDQPLPETDSLVVDEEQVEDQPVEQPITPTEGGVEATPENLEAGPPGLQYQTTDGKIDKGKPLTTPISRAVAKIPVIGQIDQFGDAAAQGVGDFIFDAIGLVPGLRGADDWWDKHNPKSDDPVHTLIRDASAIIIPSAVGGTALVGSAKTATATREIPTAMRTLGSILAYAGVDTGVAAISSQSYEQDNMIGAFNKMFGLNLPGGTKDGMDSDKRRHLHMYEAAGFSVAVDLIQALFGFSKAIKRVNMDQKAIAIAENQLEQLRKLVPAEAADPITDTVEGWRQARKLGIKEETIKRIRTGKTDYDPFINNPARPEERVISPDAISTNVDPLGAQEDLWRIQNNKGTIDGQMRPSTSKDTIDTITNSNVSNRARALSQFYEGNLTAKFDIEWDGKTVPNDQIKASIDKLTDGIFNKDLPFKEFQNIVNKGKVNVFQGRKFLSEDAWVEASYAWKNAFDTIFNSNNMKASAMMTQQAADQISTTARAMDLLGDIGTNSRQWELLSEKMKFLVGEVSANQEIGRRALELDKLVKAKDSKAVAAWLEEQVITFDEVITARKTKASGVIDEIQRIGKEHPEYVRAFAEAYEATNGDVDTLYKLHRFAEESITDLKKGLFDMHPEVPNIIIQGLNTLRYNSVLNGLAPIRAIAGNSVLSTIKPLTVFAGAAASGDVATFKRAMYTYGGITENIKRGFKLIGDDWRLANSNPALALRRGRSDLKQASLERFQALESTADAWRKEGGNDGKLAIWNIAKSLTWWNNTRFNRWGINSLYALDGMLKSFSASGNARAKAYDTLFSANNGSFNKADFQDLQRHLYNESFDRTGKLVDPSAKFDADEFALNLDSNVVNSLERVLNHVPAAKALFMFPRTGINALELSWTFTPTSNLIPLATKARRALSAKTAGEIAEVMAEHGKPNTIPAFKALQSEYIGRQIMGAGVVMGAGMWALEGNLTGNGPQDPAERSRMIRMGWKRRSIKNPITGVWHSYDGVEPFTTILGLVGDITYQANRVDQSVTEDWFRKLVTAITMNTTNDTFASGFQPLVSLYSGDEAAWNRYWANQLNMSLPQAGLRSILNNSIGGGLRDVKNDFEHYTKNNWKWMVPKNNEKLPQMLDIYTGKPIKTNENLFQDAANALLPFGKQNGDMEPWRNWLLATGWDGLSNKRVNSITGEDLTSFERQWINNWIAKHGGLKGKVIELMSRDDGYWNKQIKSYKKNLKQRKQKDFSIKKLYLHRYLDDIHDEAFRHAYSALDRFYEETSSDAPLRGRLQQHVDHKLKQGDVEGAAKKADEILNYK